MANPGENIENIEDIASDQEHVFIDTNQAENVEKIHSASHELINQMERTGLVSSKTAAQYRTGVDADKTMEGSKGFYEWMKSAWTQADRDGIVNRLRKVTSELDKAITEKVMSKKDRDFLMAHPDIVKNADFIGKIAEFGAFEKLIHDKIGRMQKDKDKWAKFRNSKIVTDSGMLVVNGTTQIEIPDEKKFLDMSVPERRKLLEKIEKAFPAAEKYAEEVGSVESATNVKAYEKALQGALQQKLIGKKTYKSFIDSFKKIDPKEQKRWLKEFNDQMGRYRELWGNIRSTLKGAALQKMEGMRDTHGWNDLFAAFGQVKEQESKRLTLGYAQGLERAKAEGLIGKHTYESYIRDFENQELKTKYEWTDKLNSEMNAYRNLRTREQALSADQQAVIAKHFDAWGRSEREAFLKAPHTLSDEPADEGDDQISKIIKSVDRKRVQKNIQWATEIIDGDIRPTEVLISRLNDTLKRGKTEHDSMDYADRVAAETAELEAEDNTAGVQDEVALMRQKRQEKIEAMPKPKGLARVINLFKNTEEAEDTETEEEPTLDIGQSEETKQTAGSETVTSERETQKKIHQSGKVKVETGSEGAFQRTEVNKGNKVVNITRVGIGDKRGLKQALNRSHIEGDTLHFKAKEGSQIDELKYTDIRAFRDVLRIKLQQNRQGNTDKKAA